MGFLDRKLELEARLPDLDAAERQEWEDLRDVLEERDRNYWEDHRG